MVINCHRVRSYRCQHCAAIIPGVTGLGSHLKTTFSSISAIPSPTSYDAVGTFASCPAFLFQQGESLWMKIALKGPPKTSAARLRKASGAQLATPKCALKD